MMQLGIFTKTFSRTSLDETLQAVRNAGLTSVQFNMACVGLPTIPDAVEDTTCHAISEAMKGVGVKMSAISGTFNTAHPDPAVRANGINRTCHLISKCSLLGTNIVTLCAGSRDPEDMWEYHPENGTSEAWKDLAATLSQLCAFAEKHGVTLAIEPEVCNVVSDAKKALRMIEEVGSEVLKIVIDPANLFTPDNINGMGEVIEEAFALLSPYIVLAHAKDIDKDPEIRLAAGSGCLDYALYLRLLTDMGYSGALILHGLSEEEVPGSVIFLRGQLGADPAYRRIKECTQ